MRVKKAVGILAALVFVVSICILTYRYYLFTNDTLHFHSYLHQADGFRVLIFDDGDVAVNTQINADDDHIQKFKRLSAPQNYALLQRPFLKS